MFDFSDVELAALAADVQNIVYLFRLDTDPAVRLWTGFGDIFVAANKFDLDGATYRGFELQDAPAFTQLINGAAERVEFTVSGVSGDVFTVAQGDDADQVKAKRVAIGFMILDDRFAPLGMVHWGASYVADYLTFDQRPAPARGQLVLTLMLSCASRWTGRRRPPFSYYSDQDQQARHSGDLFCSRTTAYARGFNKQWPTFS